MTTYSILDYNTAKVSERISLPVSTKNMQKNRLNMNQKKETIPVKQDQDYKTSQDMKLQVPFLDDVIKQELKSDYECATVTESCADMCQCEETVEVKEEQVDQVEESDHFEKTGGEQSGLDGGQKDMGHSSTSSSSQQDILDSHVKLEHSATDMGFNKGYLQGGLTDDKRCRTCKTKSTPREKSPETDREDNIKLEPAESFKTNLEQVEDQCGNSTQTLDARNCGKSSAKECSTGNNNTCFSNSFRNVHVNNCGVVQSEEGQGKSEKCAINSAVVSQHHSSTSQNSTRTGEKPYKSDIRSTQFTQNSDLNTHKIKHTEQRPYKCVSMPYPRQLERRADPPVSERRNGSHLVDFKNNRRQCEYCSRPGKIVRTYFYCTKCSDRPHLCPKHCFRKYHEAR